MAFVGLNELAVAAAGLRPVPAAKLMHARSQLREERGLI
jgi:hypothetical protein